MLPPFDQRGNLPPGVYETNWTEFCDKFGFNSHREKILAGLQMALQLLAQANCQRVYIGDSFVTNKEYPNDFEERPRADARRKGMREVMAATTT